jgi:hypothetical protein
VINVTLRTIAKVCPDFIFRTDDKAQTAAVESRRRAGAVTTGYRDVGLFLVAISEFCHRQHPHQQIQHFGYLMQILR